jgi:hypothetical protein
MPRRTAPTCRRVSSREMVDATVEINLIRGDCFGFADLTTRAAFAVAWSDWGDELLPRYVAQFPGSRPMACYILGEIEPPTWTNPIPLCRHPFRSIDGGTVRLADTTWHRRRAELEHLDALGLIDDDEREAAVARLAGPSVAYVPLAEE